MNTNEINCDVRKKKLTTIAETLTANGSEFSKVYHVVMKDVIRPSSVHRGDVDEREESSKSWTDIT